MTETTKEFDIDETIFQPELPGENLTVTLSRDQITFYGDTVRESISADENSVIYCEDNC
jgi:hypothetical protein